MTASVIFSGSSIEYPAVIFGGHVSVKDRFLSPTESATIFLNDRSADDQALRTAREKLIAAGFQSVFTTDYAG